MGPHPNIAFARTRNLPSLPFKDIPIPDTCQDMSVTADQLLEMLDTRFQAMRTENTLAFTSIATKLDDVVADQRRIQTDLAALKRNDERGQERLTHLESEAVKVNRTLHMERSLERRQAKST